MFKDELPDGIYFVGDPCYIIQQGGKYQDTWIQFLKTWELLRDRKPGVFIFKGKEHFVAPTKRGDGAWPDKKGHLYSVDSGLIGVTPISHNNYEEPTGLSTLGYTKYATNSFPVAYEDGIFWIDDLVINTRDEDEEELI